MVPKTTSNQEIEVMYGKLEQSKNSKKQILV